MKKRGLNVVAVKTQALWRKTAEVLYSRIRGAIVPAEAFDEAQGFRDEFRLRGGAEAGR